jgi:formate dehydrogenase iron-sulfur subunit
MSKALLIDTDLCLDCNACTVECKRNNDVPVGQKIAWTKIAEFERGTYPKIGAYFIKHACNHCTNPSCMQACPTGAISRPDGVHVVINQDWCIGCGYCVEACPFGVPHFGDPKGSAQKCNFCYGRRADDEPTACAAACPFGAITFGERQELIATGQARVEQLRQQGKANANLYGLTQMGGLNVLYVLADVPSAYGLPEDPKPFTRNLAAAWAGGVLAAGLLTLMPFYAVFRRRQEVGSAQERQAGRDESSKDANE